jgi:hypothetical protein
MAPPMISSSDAQTLDHLQRITSVRIENHLSEQFAKKIDLESGGIGC